MTTYAIALLLVAGAVLAGEALCRAAGWRDWSYCAPAVGLAALMALASAGAALPGAAGMAVAAPPAAAMLAGAVALARRPALSQPVVAFAIAAVVVGFTALPFLAAGRVGILGVSLNNDTATHLVWADGLRSQEVADLFSPSGGYPLGPHALMAASAELTGGSMEAAMTGFTIAAAVLLGWAAASALAGVPWWLRWAPAGLAAIAYLAAAYYGQGAFKEIAMALFVLAFAAGAEQLPAGRPRTAIPLGVLAGGGLLVYSYIAAAWFAAGLATWALLALAARRPAGAEVRAAARFWLAAAAAALVAVAATLPAIVEFVALYRASPSGGHAGVTGETLANLSGPLSPLAAFGLWPSGDFRVTPTAALHTPLAWLGVAAAGYGVAWSLRRGMRAVPAFLIGCGALYVVARAGGQAPYFTAKALAIAAPLVLLVSLRALAAPAGGGVRKALAVVALAAVALAAGWSSALVLRNSPVGSGEALAELKQLRALVAGGDTLFLGRDDYAAFALRGVRIGAPAPTGLVAPLPVAARPEKPVQPGQPLDVDTVDAPTLDRFRFVITPATHFASAPPPNLRLLRALELYELWERTGSTPSRAIVEQPGAIGGTLDCDELPRRSGVAGLAPDVVGAPPLPLIAPGSAADVQLPLAPGRWELSAQYQSVLPLRILTETGRYTLPPSTAAPGPFFRFATVDSRGGPFGLRVIAERASRITPRTAVARVATIAATAVGRARNVPLRRACGEWVDWYRVGARTAR